MEQYRTCIKCGQVKLLTDFLIDKSKSTGYKSVCLACGRLINNYKGNPDAPRTVNPPKGMGADRATYNKNWSIKNPERRKAINEKYQIKNRAKNAERMRISRLNNPGQYQDWVNRNPDKANANWNKRRANLDAAKLYVVSKKQMKKLYDSPCFYCGSFQRIQADHVIPISRGGKHSIGNLVPACAKCNMSKHNKTIMEWRKWKNEAKRFRKIVS